MVIDEFQRGGADLLLAIKHRLDMTERFLERAMAGASALRAVVPVSGGPGAVAERIARGGFPEVVTAVPAQGRSDWFHARDNGGRHEVDAVIEWLGGDVAGVEVKRSRSVKTADAAGLRWLAQRCQGRMTAGVVLYGGAEVHPLGDDILAMPISALWSG